MREFGKPEIQYVEKIVEVPQIQIVDKFVEVPQIQEIVKQIPMHIGTYPHTLAAKPAPSPSPSPISLSLSLSVCVCVCMYVCADPGKVREVPVYQTQVKEVHKPVPFPVYQDIPVEVIKHVPATGGAVKIVEKIKYVHVPGPVGQWGSGMRQEQSAANRGGADGWMDAISSGRLCVCVCLLLPGLDRWWRSLCRCR